MIDIQLPQLQTLIDKVENLSSQVEALLQTTASIVNVEPNELLDKKQAAKHLGLSIASINKYMQQGKLPYIKMAQKVLFRKGELDQFIRNGERIILKRNSNIADKFNKLKAGR